MNRVFSEVLPLGNVFLRKILVRSSSYSSNLLVCRPCLLQSHMTLRTATRMYLTCSSHVQPTSEIQNPCISGQIRNASSGWMQSLKTKIGWPQKMKHSKYKLVESAYHLYMCAVEMPDYFHMIHDLKMPDTYYSWYLLSELHAWMILVRLSVCGEEGKFTRGQYMKAFWADVKKRSSKVGTSPSRQEELTLLHYHFNSAIFSYDEGLLSDDRILANALWRIFFECDVSDPCLVELMVQYVRKQVTQLHQNVRRLGLE